MRESLRLAAATGSLVLLFALPARAQLVLANDDFTGVGTCFFALPSNAEVAARLTPPVYPFQPTKVLVLPCGTEVAVVAISIRADNGGLSPGAILWDSIGAYLVTPNVLNEIELSPPPPPITSGSIRVSFVDVTGTSVFGVVGDAAVQPNRNFYRTTTGSWVAAETGGVTGDLLIRVVGTTPTPIPLPRAAPLLAVALALVSAAAARARARR